MFAFLKKLNRDHRNILYTCFFAFFCNGLLALTMGSVLPDLKAVYALSDTTGGILLSAHSAGNLIAGFFSGVVPFYLGEKKSIVMLSSLSFLGMLMITLWGNTAFLLLAFLMVGIGRGSISNFNNRTVNRLSGGSAAASNLLHSTFAVGAISAPMFFLVLRNRFGWQAGLLFVVLAGCVSLFLLSRMKMSNDRPDKQNKDNRSMAFFKNPSFLILAAMLFCYLCSEYAINGWLVTFIQSKQALVQEFGRSGKDAQTAIGAYSQSMATLLWTVMLAGRLTCAALSAKVPQKTMMMVASFGVVAFFALMLQSNSVAAATMSVAGLGFCMAGICPMIYSDAALFTNAYPLATGALLGIGSSGAILMPTLVGAVAERAGFTGGMSVILVTVLLLAVFSVLNITVKTRLPHQAEA